MKGKFALKCPNQRNYCNSKGEIGDNLIFAKEVLMVFMSFKAVYSYLYCAL
jgi:hypothetical protein